MLQQHGAYQTRWMLEQHGVNLTANTCRWYPTKHCGLCRNQQTTSFSFHLYSATRDIHMKLRNTWKTHYTYTHLTNTSRLANIQYTHTHTHIFHLSSMYAKAHTWMPTHIDHPRLHTAMHTHIHNVLPNRNGERCMFEMAEALICFSCLSRQCMTTQQWYNTTRNNQINKLRKEEERVERGRQQSPNNKLRGGESLGNIIQGPGKHWNYIYSKQLFHWQHFHWGTLLTVSCVLFFHLKREMLLTPLRIEWVLKLLKHQRPER